MVADVPFREVNDIASRSAEALCRRWLPTGHKSGCWWVAPVPWRKDNHPSLIVHLQKGFWKDCARNETGDLIRLFANIYKTDLVTAAEDVAVLVGHDFRRRRAG